MKRKFIYLFLVGFALLSFSSCKSEFEKLRQNGDVDLLLTKAFEYYDQEEWFKAQTLFELVINNLRGKVEAEKVYFYYAYTHYHLDKYILASYYFKNFSNTFSNSQYREEADFMTAYANYKLSPTFRLEQTYSQKAIEDFQLFVNTYPLSERVPECNDLIDGMRKKMEQKAYNEAELYFNLRQYQAATHSFETMLKEYPETDQVENIRFMITRASFLLAENSVYEKKEKRYQDSINNANRFLKRYPQNEHVKEVENILKNSSKKIKEFI